MQLQDDKELKINLVHKLAMLTHFGHLDGMLGNQLSYDYILGALCLMKERKHDVSLWDFFVNVAHQMLNINTAATA
jgi:hypothetical protein